MNDYSNIDINHIKELNGKRLADLRKVHGLTQEGLAEMLDCSVKHISHAERGITFLSMEKYLILSRYFQCSMDYLLKGRDNPDISAFLPSYMVETLQSGDSEERDLLINYLFMFTKIRNLSDRTDS